MTGVFSLFRRAVQKKSKKMTGVSAVKINRKKRTGVSVVQKKRKSLTGIGDMPDDILRNILSRLPVKPMAGRCRCVSTRWNALISDPTFLISRSPMIFLASTNDDSDSDIETCIYRLDESMEDDEDLDFSSTFYVPYEGDLDRRVRVVGTFSGIVLLVVNDHAEDPRDTWYFMDEHMILCNPLTGVYDILDDPYPFYYDRHAYGFGYGATTPDELKIVRFRTHRSKKPWNVCEVFNLKTRSWSQLSEVLLPQDADFQEPAIGTFLKGYLYWLDSSKIMALDVDKMLFSEMRLPDSAIKNFNDLGTCHGCLWMITNTDVNTHNFDVWVMNIEQGVDNSWSKTCSLAIGLKPEHRIGINSYRIIEITEDGRIIIFIRPDNMIIYDTSKHSYKLLELITSLEDPAIGIGYKKSLISPMNICRV